MPGLPHVGGTMASDDPIDTIDELLRINERLLVAGLRQHARTEMVEHERREKAILLESVNIGIVGFDGALRCTSINRAAAQLLAIGPAAALGWDIHGVLHAGCTEDVTPPGCPLARVLASETALRIEDGMLWRWDGSSFPAMYSADPVTDGERTQGRVIVFADLTERKRVEAAVLRAGQMEQRLEGVKLAVREVAHLVNNDLALAVGTLDLLQRDRGLSAEALENLSTALTAIDAAVQHLRKFQRVVRVETQETPIGLTLDVERSI